MAHRNLIFIMLVLAVAFTAGCPWFKSHEMRDKELQHAAAGMEQSLTRLEKHYPHHVKLLRERWKSAKPAFDKAGDTAAKERAMAPVNVPLNHIEGVENFHHTIKHNLKVNAKRVGEEQQQRYTKEADDTRKKLMDGKPGTETLDATLRKAYDAMFATQQALQRELGSKGK